MKRYRIVKHTHERYENGELKTSYTYEVQKRFLGFLWWYNFENIDAYTDGVYNTMEEAMDAVRNEMLDRFFDESEVVWTA